MTTTRKLVFEIHTNLGDDRRYYGPFKDEAVLAVTLNLAGWHLVHTQGMEMYAKKLASGDMVSGSAEWIDFPTIMSISEIPS